jgi:hypothetical protein
MDFPLVGASKKTANTFLFCRLVLLYLIPFLNNCSISYLGSSFSIPKNMIYYTQLIFVKKGAEADFNAFEEKVLPLLKNHNGTLIYRLRPDAGNIIESSRELPYEIHLVSFGSKADFEKYKNDPKRLAFMELKNGSIEKAVLIEGIEL